MESIKKVKNIKSFLDSENESYLHTLNNQEWDELEREALRDKNKGLKNNKKNIKTNLEVNYLDLFHNDFDLEKHTKILEEIKEIPGYEDAVANKLVDLDSIAEFLQFFPERENTIKYLFEWVNEKDKSAKIEKFINFITSFDSDSKSNKALGYIFGSMHSWLTLLNVVVITTSDNAVKFSYEFYNKSVDSPFAKAVVEYFVDSYHFSTGFLSDEEWIQLRKVFMNLKIEKDYSLRRFNQLIKSL